MLQTQELISCFFNNCESKLSFLKEHHDFQPISGLVKYKHGRKLIRPYRNGTIPENFWALSRFEKQDIAIEISYHREEYILESHIYFGFVNRYNLSDLTHAAKKADERLDTQYGIGNESDLIEKIHTLGRAIHAHSSIITSHNEKLLKRANTIRNKRIESLVRERYNRDKKQATEKAAKAFMEKDYKKVIELYHPYREDLKAIDLKKYKRAVEAFKSEIVL